MTCPPAPRLDAYLDGDLDAADHDRVRRHVEACAACAAVVDAERQLAEAFVRARSVRAPEGLVAAALAEARKAEAAAPARAAARPAPAADRAPTGPPARTRTPVLRRVVVLGCAVAAALVSTWALLDSAPDSAPAVAERVAPAPAPLADDGPAEPPALPPQTPPAAQAPAAPPAPPAAPAPPPAEPRPEEAPDSPLVADAALDGEDAPSPADVEQAKRELQLAFALVADAQRQAGRTVRAEAGTLSDALDSTIPF